MSNSIPLALQPSVASIMLTIPALETKKNEHKVKWSGSPRPGPFVGSNAFQSGLNFYGNGTRAQR